MPLIGSSVNNPNYLLRFCLLVFVGVISVAVALSWRSQLLFAAEYQDLPVTHQQLKIKKENEKEQLKMVKNFKSKLITNEEE